MCVGVWRKRAVGTAGRMSGFSEDAHTHTRILTEGAAEEDDDDAAAAAPAAAAPSRRTRERSRAWCCSWCGWAGRSAIGGRLAS